MEIRAVKTFNSRDYGLIRTGIKLTVDPVYARQLLASGLAVRHVPRDLEQQREPPRKQHVPAAPRTPEQPPNPRSADPGKPAQGAGSATSTSGRRRGGGKGRRSSSRQAAPA